MIRGGGPEAWRHLDLADEAQSKPLRCPFFCFIFFFFLSSFFLSFLPSSFNPSLSLFVCLSCSSCYCTSRLARLSHSPRDPRPVHQPVIDDPPRRPRSPEDRAVCYRVTTFHEPVSPFGGFPRIARAFENRGKRGGVFESFFPKDMFEAFQSLDLYLDLYREIRELLDREDINVVR